MATEEITISELEYANEVLPDMVIAVDGSTDTKAITLGQIKDWIDIEGYVLQKLPRGIVFPFGGSTAPSGFLLCDGSAISRTTYADLFQVIGTTYGSGDGATTFNLPNFSSARFITSSTVSVKGNGKTLGLTNGSANIGLYYNADSVFNTGTQSYNTNVGTTLSTLSGATARKTVGITTDASTSGIVGTASLASACKFIIKY